MNSMTEEIAAEVNAERPNTTELILSSIGTRKMQILKVPHEGPGTAWEFAYGTEGWVLSRSQARRTKSGVLLKGYEPLVCPGDALHGVFKKLTSSLIPFFIPETNLSGLEGTFYEVTIYGGVYQSINLKWWGNEPQGGWKEFSDVVLENLAFFESLSLDKKKDKWWETKEG